jgi:uncharacterized tellurite resistance protein B-like protein
MSNSPVIMSLAKVMVAAAWADGDISLDEVNSLKDLLFHLPDMTAGDWAQIDIYIDSPIDEAERLRLVEDLRHSLSSPADKDNAQRALQQIVQADGGVSPAEQAVVDEIQAALQQAQVGGLSSLGGFLRGKTKKRSEAVADAPNRELYLDDFVKNKIYYDVVRRLAAESAGAEISPDMLRKLSLAGGLMARVAFVDRQVTDAERSMILDALQNRWGLSSLEASVVAEAALSEIGKGMDYFRLTRQFFECTTEEERLRFLDVLFGITAADGGATFEEIEEIRSISNVLKLTHQQFIDAKLKIPRELRAD